MGLVFNHKNIEVKFFSNAIISDSTKKELIIYPVLAYKIYAPVIDDLELNIFQKYVLSILNKGNFSLEKISEWLGLDITLVKTIAVELSNKNLLDINTLNITQKGKELIEGSFSWFTNAENLKKDIRYIFQDVFTQELYPIVFQFDNFQQDIYLKNRELHVDTKGKKDTFPYTLIKPENINLNKIRKPEIEDILDALSKHFNKYVPDSKNDIKKMPNAVSYLDEEPDLIYCAIWISSEHNNKQEENIDVYDPFNVYDDAFWLRNNILKAQKQNDTLKKVIHNLVYNIEQEEKEKLSEFMQAFEKEIEKELDNTFDFRLKTDYKLLYNAIKEYYFDIKFYEIHKNTSYLKNSFRKSQIVLETLFKIIFEKYKEDYEDVLSSQTYNGGRFHAYKDEVIAKIKKINDKAEIPNWGFKEFKDVYGALKNPKKASLRALFIASIMAAFYNNEIPIYKILKSKNNTAICIENIAESRNKVGHKYVEIPNEEIDKYFDDVKNMQKDIEEIIQIFLKN